MSDSRSNYDKWHSRLPVDAEASTPWHNMLRDSLAESDLAGQRVLEIGCGRGGFACWLAGAIPDVRLTAADFSPAAISMGQAFAEARELRNVTWCVADIQRLPWQDGSFDTVISCETIEHVPDPQAAVRELCRVLLPSGRLFLTVPNYFNLAGVHRLYRKFLRGEEFREEGQPINHFVLLPRVARWVAGAGMTITTVRSVNHSIPFPRREGIVIPRLAMAPFPFPWLGSNAMIVATKER